MEDLVRGCLCKDGKPTTQQCQKKTLAGNEGLEIIALSVLLLVLF
jgi:hypothetical protein